MSIIPSGKVTRVIHPNDLGNYRYEAYAVVEAPINQPNAYHYWRPATAKEAAWFGEHCGWWTVAHVVETLPDPKFTWRDLLPEGTRDKFTTQDSARDDLPEPLKRVLQIEDEMEDATVGAFMLFNETQDVEGGHVVFLAGQTAEQERRTVANVDWYVTRGYLAAEARVGEHEECDTFTDSNGDVWQIHPIFSDSYEGR